MSKSIIIEIGHTAEELEAQEPLRKCYCASEWDIANFAHYASTVLEDGMVYWIVGQCAYEMPHIAMQNAIERFNRQDL